MSKSSNRRVHVVMTPRQYEQMVKLSEQTGYSISELMRRAVDTYLTATKKKAGG